MGKKNLIIITRGYPLNAEELSFLVQEMQVLQRYYKIQIVAKYNVVERDPSDCEYPYEHCSNVFPVWKKVLFLVKTIFDKRVWREFVVLIKKKSFNFFSIRHVLSECYFSKNAECAIKKCIKKIPSDEEIIFYSYWYDYTLLALTNMKSERFKIITRTHGFDLYNERCFWGGQCFKEQLEEKIDKIVFISEYGKKYYVDVFAKKKTDLSKLAVNYLGVKPQKYKAYNAHEGIRLISCSSLISLKRVDKIIEALSLIDEIEVEWVHIGDGRNKDVILEKARCLLDEKENVQYCFKGYLESKDVFELYRKDYYDCFILLSDTEGLPVSIMEAMAFGIPVIASDVGGVSEIVDGNNGYLVKNTESAEEVVEILRKIYALSDYEKENMRKYAYYTWKTKFNSEKNAEKLMWIIEEVSEKCI